jgi:hypothetical protein
MTAAVCIHRDGAGVPFRIGVQGNGEGWAEQCRIGNPVRVAYPAESGEICRLLALKSGFGAPDIAVGQRRPLTRQSGRQLVRG